RRPVRDQRRRDPPFMHEMLVLAERRVAHVRPPLAIRDERIPRPRHHAAAAQDRPSIARLLGPPRRVHEIHRQRRQRRMIAAALGFCPPFPVPRPPPFSYFPPLSCMYRISVFSNCPVCLRVCTIRPIPWSMQSSMAAYTSMHRASHALSFTFSHSPNCGLSS